MLYFKLGSDGKVEAVSTGLDAASRHGQWLTRHKFIDILHANRIAHEATELTGTLYVGVDKGASTWPRYDVIRAPAVGDKVSYGFNGDYYPDGEIIHVTAGTLRQVKTSTGNTYYRYKDSASWKQTGGTWSLVPGHIDERNPSF